MKVTFNQLCRSLSEKVINIFLKSDENIHFTDVRFISKNQSFFLKNIIYLGKTSMLQEYFKEAARCKFYTYK